MDFKDKTILITGNGTFANAMIEHLLKTDAKEIIIYSRNEEKQVKAERKYKDNRIKYVLGDIRDYATLNRAMQNVDYCIHTAALKHVKKCEENVLETKTINIDGSINVINASINNNVKKLVCLSTDKASNACTIYGTSKYIVEKIICGIDTKNTCITYTRYGNVAGSSGSVIPLFKQLAKENKPLTLTNPKMTRFYITIEQAINSVLYALEFANNKDLVVYKSKSATVQQVADCISNKQIVTGTSCIEKTNEALLTLQELKHCKEEDNYYIYNERYTNNKEYAEALTSNNAERYTQEELKNIIERC